MTIKIDVHVTAPELAESISRLAQALPHLVSEKGMLKELTKVGKIEPTKGSASSPSVKQVAEQESQTHSDVKPTPATKEITLEQVRAKLAALSQDGKQAEVKALITEFGVKKLSDVPAEKYSELLAKAEVL